MQVNKTAIVVLAALTMAVGGILITLVVCFMDQGPLFFLTHYYKELSAIGTLLISLAAFIVSVFSLETQRKYQEIAVRPIPRVYVGDYVDSISVGIKNPGVGPLIIRSFQVDSGAGYEDVNLLLDVLPSAPEGVIWGDFSSISSDTVVPAREYKRLLLFNIYTDQQQYQDFAKNLRYALGKLKIKVTGTDVYESQVFEFETDLSWFHRGQEKQ